MQLFANRAPAPNANHTTTATPSRAGAVHVKLNAGDMPIIRTSGDLDKWKKLHVKIKPFKSEKSGVELLAEARAERESRRS